MKFDRILVPLDGSARAEAALGTALTLLRDRPAGTLLLIRAAEATSLLPGDRVDAQVSVVHEAQDYLDAVAARLRDVKVETAVWYGAPAPAIVEAARVSRVDLVVMSTHGRSGLGRLVLGSVAESVLRNTHTPILLVRAGAAPMEPPLGLVRADKEAVNV